MDLQDEYYDSTAESLEAPHFIQALNDIVAVKNETVRLKCIITGNPLPVVKWYIDGKPVATDLK